MVMADSHDSSQFESPTALYSLAFSLLKSHSMQKTPKLSPIELHAPAHLNVPKCDSTQG
jgi:hypothetical protein